MSNKINNLCNTLSRMILSRDDGAKKSHTERVAEKFLILTERTLGNFQGNRQLSPVTPKRKAWRELSAYSFLTCATLPMTVTGIALKALSMYIDPDYLTYCTTDPDRITQSPTGYNLIPPLKLPECSCPFWNRTSTPNNRATVIENTIARIKKCFRPNFLIRLGSLGAYGLGTEFDILQRLSREGYKNITMDCIEPRDIDLNETQRIVDYFAKYGVKVQINRYKSINDVPENAPWDVLLAMDFDGIVASWEKNPLQNPWVDIFGECKAAADLVTAFRKSSLATFTCCSDVVSKDQTAEPLTVSSVEFFDPIRQGLHRRPGLSQLIFDINQQLSQPVSSNNNTLSIVISQNKKHFMAEMRPGEILLALSICLSQNPDMARKYESINIDFFAMKQTPSESTKDLEKIQKQLSILFPKTPVQLHSVSLQQLKSDPYSLVFLSKEDLHVALDINPSQ